MKYEAASLHVSSSRWAPEGRRQSETYVHLRADERPHREVGLDLNEAPGFS